MPVDSCSSSERAEEQDRIDEVVLAKYNRAYVVTQDGIGRPCDLLTAPDHLGKE